MNLAGQGAYAASRAPQGHNPSCLSGTMLPFKCQRVVSSGDGHDATVTDSCTGYARCPPTNATVSESTIRAVVPLLGRLSQWVVVMLLLTVAIIFQNGCAK